jgi:hypothetical protein
VREILLTRDGWLRVCRRRRSRGSTIDNDERSPRTSAPPAPAAAEVKPPSFSDSAATATAEAKAKVFRLFGREQPIHKDLGGGKRTALLLVL